MHIEVLRIDPLRSDGVMRELERAAGAGDVGAGERLESYLLPRWETCYAPVHWLDAKHPEPEEDELTRAVRAWEARTGQAVVRDRWGDEEVRLAPDLSVYDGRNYGVFAALTGTVRNGWGIEGIVAPRGIPEDATDIVRWNWEHVGEHTPTWLLGSEILGWEGWNQARVHGEQFLAFVRDYAERFGAEQVRFVFWFDS